MGDRVRMRHDLTQLLAPISYRRGIGHDGMGQVYAAGNDTLVPNLPRAVCTQTPEPPACLHTLADQPTFDRLPHSNMRDRAH